MGSIILGGFDNMEYTCDIGGGLQDGNWHLFGLYWDGSTSINIWIDNGFVQTLSVSTKPTLQADFYIGNPTGWGTNFDMIIDDFRAWGAVLDNTRWNLLRNY